MYLSCFFSSSIFDFGQVRNRCLIISQLKSIYSRALNEIKKNHVNRGESPFSMKLQLKCVIILEVLVEIGAPYIMALHVCKCEVTLVQICFSKVGKLKI